MRVYHKLMCDIPEADQKQAVHIPEMELFNITSEPLHITKHHYLCNAEVAEVQGKNCKVLAVYNLHGRLGFAIADATLNCRERANSEKLNQQITYTLPVPKTF